MMRRFLLFILTLTFSLTPIKDARQSSQSRGSATFYCGQHSGKYSLIASHPQRGDVVLIVWKTDPVESSLTTAEYCQVVARRFDFNQATGTLNYIVSGIFNGYLALCASKVAPTNDIIVCNESTVLFILNPEDNPQEIIRKMFENNTNQSVSPLRINLPRDPNAFFQPSSQFHLLLLAAYQEQLDGNYSQAELIIRQAISIDPTNTYAYYMLGNVLQQQEKHKEAIENYRKVIQINSNYGNAYDHLGRSLILERKLEEAEKALRKALELETTNTEYTYNNLGYALQQQEKYQEAIENYKKSLAIDPNFPSAQNNLKEAERLLALKTAPTPPITIDDRQYLPSINEEPLVPYLRSTTRIIATVSEGASIGAGWVMKREGNTVWIVTNRHVLSDRRSKNPTDKIEVEFYSELSPEQRPRYSATLEKITSQNESLDLAVLKVTGIPDDIKPLTPKQGRIRRNSTVTIIGHPFTVITPWVTVRGEVINYNPNIPQIPLDATVAQGNSGGPVINENGEIVAMMVSIRASGDIAADPNIPTPVFENTPATGGVGLAYRIDIIMEKLREWGY